MLLEFSAALALAQRCAPDIAPQTLLPVVSVESGFDTLAIGVNKGAVPAARPRTPGEAAAAARRLLAAGGDLDLGLAQINSGNLAWLGLSVEDAFEPCRNLAAAAQVLKASYRPAAGADPQAALRDALSRYNTGHPRRGFANGYVAKVETAARRLAPALSTAPSPLTALATARATEVAAPEVSAAPRDVFARPAADRRLVFTSVPGAGS